MLRQGDIVLIPIPFTDLSSLKRRPVIIVSNDEYNRVALDIVVVAMTSNPTSTIYTFTITSADMAEGSLNRPGTVRVDKVYTLEQSLIAKVFGRVNTATLDHIRSILRELVAQKP